MHASMHAAPAAGMIKRPSKKWTEQEQLLLLSVVNSQGLEKINWAHVAKSLPGRTGKQCREKWKNDLRPDIFKDPWNKREEYILARLHSEVGNQWAEIAKFLPGRSENSIKNHWNATLRSKAEAKRRTLLGIYGRIVVEQQGATSLKAFQGAVEAYQAIPGVDHIETMQVAEEFFQRRPSTSTSPVRVKIGRSRTAPAAARTGQAGRSAARTRTGKRNRYDLSDSDSMSDCDADGSYMEDDGEDDASETHLSRQRRSSAGGGPRSRRSSEVASGVPGVPGPSMAPLPPSSCLGYAYSQMVGIGGAGGRMHGDASAVIKLSAPPHMKKSGPVPPHALPHAQPYHYAYPPHGQQYPPYRPPGPTYYNPHTEGGAPYHQGGMSEDEMHRIAYEHPVDDGGCGSVGVDPDWNGDEAIDLDEGQDLGWSPLELEMLRGIADLDDVVGSAGTDEMTQVAVGSPGSAATAAAAHAVPLDMIAGAGQGSNMAPADEGAFGCSGRGMDGDAGPAEVHELASWKEEPEEHGRLGVQVLPTRSSSCHGPEHASHAPPPPCYMMAHPPHHGAWVPKSEHGPMDLPHYMAYHPAHGGRYPGEYAPRMHYHMPRSRHEQAYMAAHYGPPHHPHHHMHAPEPHMHPHPHPHPHPYSHHHMPYPCEEALGGYPAKPWAAHPGAPAPSAQQPYRTPSHPSTHEERGGPAAASGNGGDGAQWGLSMSPSDYLPALGMECAGSPELRGLDDLVSVMV